MAHIEVTVSIVFSTPSSVSTIRELKLEYVYGDNPRYALEAQSIALDGTVSVMQRDLKRQAEAMGVALNPTDCREYPRLIG